MPQGTGAAEPANLLHDQVGEADQQGEPVSSGIGRRSSQVATKLATRPQPSGRISSPSWALARLRLALLPPRLSVLLGGSAGERGRDANDPVECAALRPWDVAEDSEGTQAGAAGPGELECLARLIGFQCPRRHPPRRERSGRAYRK
jgi:hypothetical protein